MNRMYSGLIYTKALKVIFSGGMIINGLFSLLILTAFPDFSTINTLFTLKKYILKLVLFQ